MAEPRAVWRLRRCAAQVHYTALARGVALARSALRSPTLAGRACRCHYTGRPHDGATHRRSRRPRDGSSSIGHAAAIRTRATLSIECARSPQVALAGAASSRPIIAGFPRGDRTIAMAGTDSDAPAARRRRRARAGARLRLPVRPAHRPPRARAGRVLRDRAARHHRRARARAGADRAHPLRRPGERVRRRGAEVRSASCSSSAFPCWASATACSSCARRSAAASTALRPASTAAPSARSSTPTSCSPACRRRRRCG